MQNYAATIIRQYSGSPAMGALLQTFNDAEDPSANITAFYNLVFNVLTAQGYGLDVWGRIVGVVRILAVPSYGNYALSDDAFRTLILAKALSNISNATVQNINAILMNLFPGLGDCYVVDNFDMTMSLTLGFTPDAIQAVIISGTGVLPRPAGVLLNGSSPTIGMPTISIQTGIQAGAIASGPFPAYAYGPNQSTVTGGSGNFSYAWTLTPLDSFGAWTLAGQGTSAAAPQVAGVAQGVSSSANLSCTVTDNVTGDTATSGTVTYTFTNTTAAPPTVLAVTILPGVAATGFTKYWNFGPNSATVTGGVGPFTFAWSEIDDGIGNWAITGANQKAINLNVTNVQIFEGEDPTGIPASSQARLVCAVTDSTGARAVSAPSTYRYTNLNTGHGRTIAGEVGVNVGVS